MNLQAVDSTLVEAVCYDNAMQELEVIFTNGRTYRYVQVPRDVYTALLAAESKGRFMHTQVLGVYPWYEVVRRR